MKYLKRLILPLLLTALLLALLGLTACRKKAPETSQTTESTSEKEPAYFLTNVTLDENETPVLLLTTGEEEPETQDSTQKSDAPGESSSGTQTPKPPSSSSSSSSQPEPTTPPSSSLTGPIETPIIPIKPKSSTNANEP